MIRARWSGLPRPQIQETKMTILTRRWHAVSGCWIVKASAVLHIGE